MNRYKTLFAALLAGSMLFAGCSKTDTSTEETTTTETTTFDSSDDTTTTTDTTTTETTDTDTDDTEEEAKDDAIDIEGTEVSKSGTINLSDYDGPVKITASGTYTITGTGSMVIVDAKKQDVTLVLDNATITNDSLPPIYVKKAASVTIELEGTNTLKMGSNYEYEALNACLYSKADLVLTGSGTLNLDSGYEHGIKAKDTLVVNGGTYNITAKNDGVHVNETAEFNDGTWTINASGEGIESKDTLTFNGGTYTINAADDGLNAANALTFNDGTFTVISTGNDAVDSNGDLIINGGSITAVGLKTPEQAFDVDNTPFQINGGTVIGLGSSAAYPSNCAQAVLMIGGSGTVNSVEIKDGSTTIAQWTLPSSSQAGGSVTITMSSPNMKVGTTYTVYINGSEYSDVTLSDTVTSMGNISSMGGGGMGGGMQGGMQGGGMGGRGGR